ncbi:hypothetical protein AAGS61_02925 [Lysinibacillus sp. KU-BSD001]|uniref:hypothetical protein n=1 Tax=Lysinibacillus sp. KU-BSD001 TaxID=3141328 RepID=UPI0036E213B1
MTTVEEAIMNNQQIIELIVAIASEVASEKAIEEYQKKKKAIEQEEKNKRLHNVEELLKSYIMLKEYVKRIDEKAKASISSSVVMKETESLIELLEFSDDIVGAIKESSQRTIVMIRHMDSALEALEFIYKRENNERDFNILKKRYVDATMPAELAEFYQFNKRTIQKILSRVRARYSVLLFGIYGVKLE